MVAPFTTLFIYISIKENMTKISQQSEMKYASSLNSIGLKIPRPDHNG